MDYLSAMNEIFDKEYKSIVSKQENCQYKGKGDRYCLATTHRTCRGCRMFSPTTQSKLKIVIEKTAELRQKVRKRDETITDLREEIKRLNNIIELKDTRLEVLEKRLEHYV